MQVTKAQAEESLKYLAQIAGQAPVALAVHVAAQNAAERVRQFLNAPAQPEQAQPLKAVKKN